MTSKSTIRKHRRAGDEEPHPAHSRLKLKLHRNFALKVPLALFAQSRARDGMCESINSLNKNSDQKVAIFIGWG